MIKIKRLDSGTHGGAVAQHQDYLPTLLLLPALIFLLVVTMPPFIYGIVVSFTRWSLTRPDRPMSFIGLENYRAILHDPSFGTILGNTLIYTIISVGISFLLGFAIALLLNRRLRAKSIYQTLILIPMVTTPMVIALSFRYMYNSEYGILAYFLSLLGLQNISLLGDPRIALFSIVAVEVWEWTPFMILVLLAGLESLPKRPYEAAQIDGASHLQTFRYVTLPQMQRVIIVVLLIRLMDAFRSFDLIYMMTRGGPGISTETLILTTWRQGFAFFDMGKGAALSIFMLYIVLTTSWLFMRAARLR